MKNKSELKLFDRIFFNEQSLLNQMKIEKQKDK
jgi:hypothetical protein